MNDYEWMFNSEVVDVSTTGIDRGEDDYVPTDEYTPGVDDDAPRDATDVEELQCALDGIDDAENSDSWRNAQELIDALRLALDISLGRWPEVTEQPQ